MRSIPSALLIASGLVIIGCGTDPTETTEPMSDADAGVSAEPLTLARDVQPILDRYCVGCHALGAGDPHGNPHLTSDSSRQSLQGTSACMNGGAQMAFVVPGKPEDSFLLYKLGAMTSLSVVGTTCEQKMPLRADASLAETDPAAVALIRQWIVDGAR